jgi:hypothetical protein
MSSAIILHALRHTLRDSEMAVDLAAMILGYREYLRVGYQPYCILETSPSAPIIGTPDVVRRTTTRIYVGYLTQEEVMFAYRMINRLSS